MQYIKLNNTDLQVAPVCLGTVNYFSALSKEESKKQISQYLELGGNFIDTAHIYGDWEPGVLCRSEKTIGEWIKETGKRGEIVLATKGAHPDWGKMDIPRVHPENIEKDLNESLEFLNTDYIDIYFLHRDDPNVPVEKIIDYLDTACDQGKIRYYGCSNWKLSRIKEAAAYAKKKGSKGFVVNQLMWSLADINFDYLPDKSFALMDDETFAYHKKSGMNAMAYMSIAKAYFTRTYNGEDLPESITSVYDNPSNRKIYQKALEVVKSGEYSFIDISLMYLMNQKQFPTVPIASFDTPQQMISGLSSWEKEKPLKLLKELGDMKQFVYYE